jgi:hypothetical protein
MKLEDYLDDYLEELNGQGGRIIKEELGEEFYKRAYSHLLLRGQHFIDDEGRFFDIKHMQKAIEGPFYTIPEEALESFEAFDNFIHSIK